MERSSGAGRLVAPRSSGQGRLGVRRALAATVNFLNAFSRFSSSDSAGGSARAGAPSARAARVAGAGDREGAAGARPPRAPPARDRRGPEPGPVRSGPGGRPGQKRGPCWGSRERGELTTWVGGDGAGGT